MTKAQKDWPVELWATCIYGRVRPRIGIPMGVERERYISESRLLSDEVVGTALESLFPDDSNARASWSPQITDAIRAAIKAASE